MVKRLIGRILVLVDGTDRGVLAAELAIAIGRAAEARVFALAVVDIEMLKQLQAYRILVAQEMVDLEAELESSARRHLDQIRDQGLESKVVVEQILVRGPWSNSALAQVRELGVDLVVLGGFKSNQATRDLLAREYQKIMDDAPCPVLMVK